jgi:uncharacterized protein (DUF4213/DUF364 family)
MTDAALSACAASSVPAGAGSTQILDEAAARLIALHGTSMNRLVIERLVIGVFFTGVMLSDGFVGVAYTPPEAIQRASTRILKGQHPSYHGLPVKSVIDGSLSGPFAHVIRLATLNALSAPFFYGSAYTVLPDGDITGHFAWLFQRRRVCLVGAIIPLLKRIGPLGVADLRIIDKKKETSAEATLGTFVPPEEAASALASCQTAIFTGAAVANGSIAPLLDAVPPEAAVAIVGPTAGFVPDPLFRRNVAIVGTSLVVNGARALDILAEGGGAYQLSPDCLRKIHLINGPRIDQLRQQS